MAMGGSEFNGYNSLDSISNEFNLLRSPESLTSLESKILFACNVEPGKCKTNSNKNSCVCTDDLECSRRNNDLTMHSSFCDDRQTNMCAAESATFPKCCDEDLSDNGYNISFKQPTMCTDDLETDGCVTQFNIQSSTYDGDLETDSDPSGSFFQYSSAHSGRNMQQDGSINSKSKNRDNMNENVPRLSVFYTSENMPGSSENMSYNSLNRYCQDNNESGKQQQAQGQKQQLKDKPQEPLLQQHGLLSQPYMLEGQTRKQNSKQRQQGQSTSSQRPHQQQQQAQHQSPKQWQRLQHSQSQRQQQIRQDQRQQQIRQEQTQQQLQEQRHDERQTSYTRQNTLQEQQQMLLQSTEQASLEQLSLLSEELRLRQRSLESSLGDNQLGPSKYPEYREEVVRRASFISWPRRLKSSAVMSKAGLFSTKRGDSVRCFHCGIGLRNWDREDDPWVEHARWSPECQYVRIVKGQEFINLVQAAVRQAEMDEALQENTISTSTELSTQSPSTEKTERSRFSTPERKNPLLTVCAQSVVEMGYQPKLVKRAIDIVVGKTGWDSLSGETILSTIFDLEETDTELNKDKEENKENLDDNKQSGDDDITSKPLDRSKLIAENEELQERTRCKICCDNTVSIVFLPCGHLVCCAQCAPALKNCAICRDGIKGTVRVYIS